MDLKSGRLNRLTVTNVEDRCCEIGKIRDRKVEGMTEVMHLSVLWMGVIRTKRGEPGCLSNFLPLRLPFS